MQRNCYKLSSIPDEAFEQDEFVIKIPEVLKDRYHPHDHRVRFWEISKHCLERDFPLLQELAVRKRIRFFLDTDSKTSEYNFLIVRKEEGYYSGVLSDSRDKNITRHEVIDSLEGKLITHESHSSEDLRSGCIDAKKYESFSVKLENAGCDIPLGQIISGDESSDFDEKTLEMFKEIWDTVNAGRMNNFKIQNYSCKNVQYLNFRRVEGTECDFIVIPHENWLGTVRRYDPELHAWVKDMYNRFCGIYP